MSKTEILDELPKLTPDERREILARLLALDDTEWLDGGELSDEEKAILEARLDEYDKNPRTGSSWAEVQARIRAKLRAA
jgi:putative addiction module component (TIGR02574 family)